jgi:hypothetical protein
MSTGAAFDSFTCTHSVPSCPGATFGTVMDTFSAAAVAIAPGGVAGAAGAGPCGPGIGVAPLVAAGEPAATGVAVAVGVAAGAGVVAGAAAPAVPGAGICTDRVAALCSSQAAKAAQKSAVIAARWSEVRVRLVIGIPGCMR